MKSNEDIKKSIVKFTGDKQKKIKVLSRIIEVVSTIAKVCCYIALGFVALFAIILPMAIKNVEIKDNEITISENNMVKFEENDDKLTIKINESVVAEETNKDTIDSIKELLHNKKIINIGYIELCLAFVVAILVLAVFFLKHLVKLFRNINKCDTPFTLENVGHIRKMAYFMIALIVVPAFAGSIVELVTLSRVSINFDFFNIMEILCMFVLAYIFEYGYEIQQDSKGKMYGKEI